MKPLHFDRTLLIAEIGMNHDGSFGQAKALIRAAAEAGADAVKLQTHIAEAETLRSAPRPRYFTTESRYEYFKRTAFTDAQHQELRAVAHKAGVLFFSSAFSNQAVDLLVRVKADALKIPSGEVTNLPLLRRAGASGIPVLLSSGMSSMSELDAAVRVLRGQGAQYAVFQCTSMYPCPYDKVGLNLLPEFARKYRCPVGLSDHTVDNYASLAAVALGARLIERHFTLSKKGYGPDAALSLEPQEFRYLADGIRAIEAILANPVNKDRVCRQLAGMKHVFEKSVVSVRAILKGARIGAADVALKKPGGGIPPRDFGRVIGARARRAIPGDAVILPSMITRGKRSAR